MPYFLLVSKKDGTLFPLHTDERSQAECERGLSWQRIGQGANDEYAIKTREELRALNIDGKLRQSCYTDEAWKRFTESLQ